ncbi:MAG: rhombosortase [Herminiimonas sp.]|nr:rhombosortase [Herminiimonas sp.]
MEAPPRLFLHDAGRNKWLFCLGVSFCAIVFTYWPHGLAQFRYDRAAVLSGGGWRVLTAHLVHLNTMHLLFNLIGLLLLCELLWNDMPLLHAFGMLGATAIGISVLLFCFHPELAWYAGLSGSLHGLWSGCALAGWQPVPARINGRFAAPPSKWQRPRLSWPMPRWIGAAGMALLAIKLAIEFCYGPSERTVRAIGGSVVTISHLYGALIGICYVLLWQGTQLLRFEK